MATTTMRRIHDRLYRAEWVSSLTRDQQADLVVAAADVGDGRAAEELLAMAAEWRRTAHGLVTGSGPGKDVIQIARLYTEVAVDLEIRAAALRGVPKIRVLVAAQPELAVPRTMVAAEKVVVDHEVALRIQPTTVLATVHALRAWCGLLGDRRVHLLVTDHVTGLLNDCGVTVAGCLAVDEHPAVAEFIAARLADRTTSAQPTTPIGEEDLHRLADALATVAAQDAVRA